MTNEHARPDRYLVDLDTRELPRFVADVLVVGGGIAGLRAALAAAEAGARVLVLLKDEPDVCNTAWAQGGIAAAFAPDDSPRQHEEDTLRTGAGLCDEAVVRVVTEEGPAAVRDLIARGARFDRAPEDAAVPARATGPGTPATGVGTGTAGGGAGEAARAGAIARQARREARHEAPASGPDAAATGETIRAAGEGYALGREGGHSRRRVLHRGDETGAECTRALVAAARRAPGTSVRTDVFVIDLLTAPGGRCVGALAQRRDGSRFVVFAGAVVLAAGGAGRLYRETSNVRGATGDGIAAAYRAGAVLRDLEFVQFHPTTLYLAGSDRVLVTEAVRGEGAHVVDDQGRRFLRAAHPDAELAPRDVVSRAIVEHLAHDDVEGVYLDLTHWPRGRAAQRFPGLARTCARYGLDPERDPIPVRPAAHYFIGGVATDLAGRSHVPGLFACGEASCSGLHGANRLASNSLLEGLVLGARAGRAAAAEAASVERFDGDLAFAGERRVDPAALDVEDLRKSLASRMWRCAGVVRDAERLADAAEAIRLWRRFSTRVRLDRRSELELENLLLLASLVTAAAARREESRGVHGRLDFPARDDARFLGSICWQAGREPAFRPKEAKTLG